MATLEIPINPVYPSQIMSVVLDGVSYRLRVYYNYRQHIWIMDLLTNAGNDILSGVKLVPDFPLIRRYESAERRPPGEFYAVDTSGTGTPPGRFDLGTRRRVRLRYVEAA
jgi:hypothetical protein